MPTKKTTSQELPKEINKKLIKPETSVATIAKAGKRSAKAIADLEEKQAKEARKLSTKEKTEADKVQALKPIKVISRTDRRSKTYKKVYALIDQDKTYPIAEAVQLIGKTSPVKFDATVELHMRLGVDPRQADENIRDTVLLPAGSGKNQRVAVFASGDEAETAKANKADLVGEANVIQELEAGNFSFDVLISTPAQMSKLGKYARVLGPRGLMPNPKSGTVTNDIARAVKEAKSGKVEYRVDSGANLHIPVGKVSFKPEALLENLSAVISSVQSNKPSSIKGAYILNMHLSTSMGPSIKLAL
jgi:large subunit ribosomal protein L1